MVVNVLLIVCPIYPPSSASDVFFNRILIYSFPSLFHFMYFVNLDGGPGNLVIGQRILNIPCSRSILLHVMLKKHSNCTYTSFKLNQMRARDNQRWWQIQNPMPSTRRHTPELLVISLPSGRWHAALRGILQLV